MATKIVATPSNPVNAEINQLDLRRITEDFDNFVQINSTIARVFSKTNSINIPLDAIKDLVNQADQLIAQDENNPPFMRFRIKFGITLPEQLDCEKQEKSIADCLSIVVLLEKNGVELNSVGDIVITPGFRTQAPQGSPFNSLNVCCPLQPPKGK